MTLLGLLLATGMAQAEVKRYAFLVGSNQGRSYEASLRYAETDVEAVADTLIQMAGYPNERVVRVTAATADRVRGAFVDLNLRIQEDLRAGGEAVLFVYYSGHADAQNMHLGQSDLPLDEWSKLVRLSPAKLKILLVDACRSGSLTRVKGGYQVAPFQIGAQDQLRNEGFAIITAAAAGEDAQESDTLRSSIFTHHFLSALRGPGDSNRDRVVTLGEAYAYAFEQSLNTSITTIAGTQHATFDYDLRGRADPVLADLRSLGVHARLILASAGEYLVASSDGGRVFIEATAREPQLPVVLPPGTFRVRLRTQRNVYQTEVTVAAGQTLNLGGDSMAPVPLAQVVRKGETSAWWAQGPFVSGAVHGPLGPGFSPMIGGQAGWGFDLAHVTLMPRFGFATGHALGTADQIKSHTLDELTVEMAALYVFDLGRLSVAPLAAVGWGVIQQSIDRGAGCLLPVCQYSSNPQALLLSLGGWASWPLGHGFSIEASAELASFYLRRQESTEVVEGGAPRSGTLTYRTGLGVGYRY